MKTAVTAVAVAAIAISNLFAPNLPTPLDNDIPAILAIEQNPYAALYYYEADKQARYEAYQAANVDLPADEVVWRVNAGLDYDFYTVSPQHMKLKF